MAVPMNIPLTFPTRPPSKYADREDPPQEGEAFNYDAVPGVFYFDVESAGGMPADIIIPEGISVLQQKLASVIQGLMEPDGDGANGDYDGPRSPGGFGDGGFQDPGYTTPYGNGGNQGAWGGGGTTPYGQTPYGNAGQSGW
jgi:DNA-directed RNA polymerase II subunit RPB3